MTNSNMQDDDNPGPCWGQIKSNLPDVTSIEPAISGSGGDDYTFQVAKRIAGLTADYDEALAWMREWSKLCQPPWDEYRIVYKTNQGWLKVHGEDRGGDAFPELRADTLRRVKVSKVCFKELDRLAFEAKGAFAQLCESAAAGEPLPPLEEIIDQMYPKNPLICRAVGSQSHFGTGPREDLRGKEHLFEWIVPSPMFKRTGITKDGEKDSHRCRDNAARVRRYLVVEFDFGKTFKKQIEAWAAEGISSRDVQARLVAWLATEGEPRQWPFLIVDSGGKSLHNWYAIHKRFSEQNALDLLARAIPLGADYHAEQPEQFFRFPGGTRKSGKSQPQPIIFYDRTKLI